MWTYREKITYEVYDQETGYVTQGYDTEVEAAEVAHNINTYDKRAVDNARAQKAARESEAQEGDGEQGTQGTRRSEASVG